jgi:hypothetical protein
VGELAEDSLSVYQEKQEFGGGSSDVFCQSLGIEIRKERGEVRR